MATRTKAQNPPAGAAEPKESHPLYEISRKVLLASIGAMALAQDEAEAFVNRLVERGEIAEKDGKSLMREMLEKRRKRFSKVEAEVSKRMEKVLERLNIPTRQEIDALNTKIAALNKKLDELSKTG